MAEVLGADKNDKRGGRGRGLVVPPFPGNFGGNLLVFWAKSSGGWVDFTVFWVGHMAAATPWHHMMRARGCLGVQVPKRKLNGSESYNGASATCTSRARRTAAQPEDTGIRHVRRRRPRGPAPSAVPSRPRPRAVGRSAKAGDARATGYTRCVGAEPCPALKP